MRKVLVSIATRRSTGTNKPRKNSKDGRVLRNWSAQPSRNQTQRTEYEVPGWKQERDWIRDNGY